MWRHVDRIIPMISTSLVKIQITKTGGTYGLTRLTTQGLVSVLECCPRLLHLNVEGLTSSERPVVVEPSRIVSIRLKYLKLKLESDADNLNRPTSAFDTLFATLFPIVGGHLEDLLLLNEDRDILLFQIAFRALMSSTPTLSSLHLQGLYVGTLDVIVDAYYQNRSRLSSIGLSNCAFTSASSASLADCLADSTCVAARQLATFTIRLDHHDSLQLHSLDRTSLSALVRMLQHNNTLRLLWIDMDAGYSDHGQLQEFEPLFEAQSGISLPHQQRPLAIASNYSLMGVLHKKMLPWSIDTMQLVFAFAAERTVRSCRVKFGRE